MLVGSFWSTKRQLGGHGLFDSKASDCPLKTHRNLTESEVETSPKRIWASAAWAEAHLILHGIVAALVKRPRSRWQLQDLPEQEAVARLNTVTRRNNNDFVALVTPQDQTRSQAPVVS